MEEKQIISPHDAAGRCEKCSKVIFGCCSEGFALCPDCGEPVKLDTIKHRGPCGGSLEKIH